MMSVASTVDTGHWKWKRGQRCTAANRIGRNERHRYWKTCSHRVQLQIMLATDVKIYEI